MFARPVPTGGAQSWACSSCPHVLEWENRQGSDKGHSCPGSNCFSSLRPTYSEWLGFPKEPEERFMADKGCQRLEELPQAQSRARCLARHPSWVIDILPASTWVCAHTCTHMRGSTPMHIHLYASHTRSAPPLCTHAHAHSACPQVEGIGRCSRPGDNMSTAVLGVSWAGKGRLQDETNQPEPLTSGCCHQDRAGKVSWGRKTKSSELGEGLHVRGSFCSSPLTLICGRRPGLSPSQQKEGRLNNLIHFSFPEKPFLPK